MPVKSTIFKHSVFSLDLNLQSNRELLRYKALKMTLRKGPLLLQKYEILPKDRKKTNIVTLKVHDRNRKGLNMSR